MAPILVIVVGKVRPALGISLIREGFKKCRNLNLRGVCECNYLNEEEQIFFSWHYFIKTLPQSKTVGHTHLCPACDTCHRGQVSSTRPTCRCSPSDTWKPRDTRSGWGQARSILQTGIWTPWGCLCCHSVTRSHHLCCHTVAPEENHKTN